MQRPHAVPQALVSSLFWWVTLSGTVGSWSERRAAVGAAGAIHGVRSVRDQLHLEARQGL